jgi:hypothetical protein
MMEYTVRSMDEIETLKGSWTDDPCWDIEDTPGYGVWRDELLTYRIAVEAEQKAKYTAYVGAKTAALGINATLLRYIEQLEGRIEALEARVTRLEAS